MNNIKKTKLYTILFHSLIIIGAGHGIGIMGIFDVIGIIQIPEIYKNGIIFNINGDYQDRLSLVVIFSLIGKIILITSLFLNKNIITLIGIIILWISVYFLTSGNWSYDWLYGFSFLTSIPFLIYSIKLTKLILENIEQNKKLNININEK